jgi:hypothetical protein
VPGDHLSMLHAPNVDAVAQILASEFKFQANEIHPAASRLRVTP